MQELVIITGPGGSGKSLALKTFEDMGFYAVDNLPVTLLPQFLELSRASGEEIRRGAVVVDIREGKQLERFPEVHARLQQLTESINIIFLDCRDDILLRRYQETRRPHPLGVGGDVSAGIRAERQALQPLQGLATNILDTSALTVHELRQYLMRRYNAGAEGPGPLSIHIISFGFKHGLPAEASLVFDVRFLPNPYFVSGLREQSGKDAPVAEYLRAQPETLETLNRLEGLLDFLLPLYEKEGKAQISIALGCTGGRHRSVFIAEALRELLITKGFGPSLMHRDLERV
jgi:UPF0042 nucleotide-binding protein